MIWYYIVWITVLYRCLVADIRNGTSAASLRMLFISYNSLKCCLCTWSIPESKSIFSYQVTLPTRTISSQFRINYVTSRDVVGLRLSRENEPRKCTCPIPIYTTYFWSLPNSCIGLFLLDLREKEDYLTGLEFREWLKKNVRTLVLVNWCLNDKYSGSAALWCTKPRC